MGHHGTRQTLELRITFGYVLAQRPYIPAAQDTMQASGVAHRAAFFVPVLPADFSSHSAPISC